MDQQFDHIPAPGKWNGMMLIGEAWGQEEERAQQPFVGRAGFQLNRSLQGVGISREEVYIANVINARPKRNDFSVYYEDKQRKNPGGQLQEARHVLLEKMAGLSPRVVVPLGNEALKAITGKEGIENWRGSIITGGSGSLVVPTIHPSAVVRGGGEGGWYLPAVAHDLKRAKLVAEGKVRASNPKVEVVERAEILETYFQMWDVQGTEVAFDIETTIRGGEQIKCISFAPTGNNAYVVSFLEGAPDTMNMLMTIKMYMSDSHIRWVGQNGYNFDVPYIWRNWGFEVKPYTFDTFVAHQMLYPELPHDLATLGSFYTTVPYWKHTAATELLKYNGYDAAVTIEVAHALQRELTAAGKAERYKTYAHKLTFPLRDMYIKGVKIDREYKETLKKDLKKAIKCHQETIDTLYTKHTNTGSIELRLLRLRKLEADGRKTIKLPNKKTGKFSRKRINSQITACTKRITKEGTLNVRSTKQLAHFLYNVLGLPKKTKKGSVTTDVTAINQLYIKTGHEFLKTIIALRKERNNYSKYGVLELDKDDRVHSTYKFCETGRLSSGKFSAK